MIGPEDDTLDLTEDLAALREAPGPPCDCPWHRRADHATQLAHGAATLTARLGAWLAGGGLQALALRASATAYGLGAAAYTLPTLSLLAPAGLLAFVAAAWRTGRPAPLTVDDARRAFLGALLDLIGDRPGIFLRDLYDLLQAHPAAAHLDDARLRAVLTDSGLTIHKSIRIGPDTGRSGLKRTDVQALLSPAPPAPSPFPVDAGHGAAEGGVDEP
ncbi:predicted protein [Streptomyces sp. SPB78]|uniref:hypothetical protein n=1 Tax=Streptomyces sp. (strain SPB78) TaxID=591157 RepID=UPI0001B56990|nr:hypothetical protein [Streptomyces sp. SPB78]EFL01601.1 predicted protein [Streptomyces sp. SPB78]